MAPQRKSLTGQLYRLARDSANVRAVAHGPGAFAKRTARRQVYRRVNGTTGKLLRRMGL